MNRTDYWSIANCLARMPNIPIKIELVLLLAEVLKKDSAKFDSEKFLDASGI